MTNFPAQARAAIDRYVGRDSLTIRPSQASAAVLVAEITRDVGSTHSFVRRDTRTERLPAPATLLTLLP